MGDAHMRGVPMRSRPGVLAQEGRPDHDRVGMSERLEATGRRRRHEQTTSVTLRTPGPHERRRPRLEPAEDRSGRAAGPSDGRPRRLRSRSGHLQGSRRGEPRARRAPASRRRARRSAARTRAPRSPSRSVRSCAHGDREREYGVDPATNALLGEGRPRRRLSGRAARAAQRQPPVEPRHAERLGSRSDRAIPSRSQVMMAVIRIETSSPGIWAPSLAA
jgi:hypothetical protein